MSHTFRGGVHIPEHKDTATCPVEILPAPKFLKIPMQQHIGAPSVPTVGKGDRVLRGQVIGAPSEGLGAPVHSSVSGTVVDVISINDANARPVKTIVIENDGLMETDPSIKPYGEKTGKTVSDLTIDELISVVKDAGISGMGGATFPTWAKIRSAQGKAEYVIVNCAECEPYITANHRLMLENPQAIIGGLKILLAALNVKEGIIAVEDNKPDAIGLLTKLTEDSDLIRVETMKTKYPQGDERQLMLALFGKELPAGKLPADIGCAIFNAETTAAIYNAFATGMPLVERIVTVSGDCVKEPKNLLVPLGTPVSELLAYCGLKEDKKLYKLISGGPMMGVALWDTETPVAKGTSAILAFSKENSRTVRSTDCIRCGRCVSHCPMYLMPTYLAQYAIRGDLDAAVKAGLMSCVECGTCTYICPADVPIVQYIRRAKFTVREQQAARKAAESAAKAAKEADTAAAAAKKEEGKA